jgi:hypothetical protein
VTILAGVETAAGSNHSLESTIRLINQLLKSTNRMINQLLKSTNRLISILLLKPYK